MLGQGGDMDTRTRTRPPLWIPWVLTRILFFVVLSIWLLIGGLLLAAHLSADEDASGTIRCPAGSYPASADTNTHRCFRNGELPAAGFTADPMTDHQREEK